MKNGPVILPNLIGMLLKTRITPILLSADVEKAFSQLRITEDDKDYFRFLWIKDINKPPTSGNIKEFRFCRVIFGAKSSPLLLAAVIETILEQSSSPISEEIRLSTYVDNVHLFAKTSKEAISKYKESKRIFKNDLSMNLRQYVSNDQTTMRKIALEDKDNQTEVSLLGVKWNTKADTLKVTFPKENAYSKITKRNVVSWSSRIFDPLGIAGPLVIPFKIFIDLWKKNYAWDEEISTKESNHFREMIKIVSETTLEIPQNTIAAPDVKCSLWAFTDASTNAFGCCVYISQKENSELLMAEKIESHR